MTSDASSVRLTLNIPLKTEEDIEAAAKFFNDTIQCAGCNAALEHKTTLEVYDCLPYTRKTPWLLVRKRTISTERPPLVSEF
jgi:hypothetical protein